MNLSKHKNLYIFLCIVFLVNLLFKLINIGGSAFWYDEIISAKDTLLDFGHIKHEAEWDKNPPFYHYVLWVWAKLFGISEVGLRSMSAFFSSLTAILIFFLADKIVNRLYAVIATVIFSIHPYLFYYAQEARCYSLLIFLICSNLLVIYHLIQRPTYLKAILLGILNFLIFYTHYIAGLVLFCQFIFLVIIFRKKIPVLICVYLTPILLVLLRFTKKQYKVLFFSNEMSQAKSNVPLSNIDYLAQSIPCLFISWVVFIVLVFSVGFYFYKRLKEKAELNTALKFKIFIAFTPFVCILMLFFLGKLTNVFHERYLIFTIPYIILAFFTITENKILTYVATSIVVVFGITQIRFGESRRMDYDFCAALTKEIEKREDVNVLIQTHDVVGLYLFYYDRSLFVNNMAGNKEELAKKGIYYAETLDDLKNLSLPDDNKPILLYQTFVSSRDTSEINKLFAERGFKRYVNNGINGVKFTYLSKK